MADHAPPLLLDEAIAEFLTTLRAGKPSGHTIRGYASDLAVIRGLLDPDPAALTVADLSVSRLRAGFAEFADTHARASVLRAWAVWNRFFTHLLSAGAIAGNPMGAVPKPKAARGAPSAFTDRDIGALISTLQSQAVPARRPWPDRDYAIIATLALTGLRRAELLALEVDDVEGSAGERQLAVRHGKGDKYRAVPIQPVLEHLIESYLLQRWARFPVKGRPSPADPWSSPARTALWLGDQGRPMTTAQLGHLVQRAYRAAGINSRRPPGALVHALRHTFATTLLEHGTTAAELQDLLGHASLATTSRYLKTRPEHLRSAVAANPVYGQIET